MCGITGFVGVGDRSDLAAMTAALAHRGPDGEGLFIDEAERVFLGHRRLAVIDQEGGFQPMADASGTIQVVFNGEIYNHADLRIELQAKGYKFRSDHSDTEVLVHGYKEWGAELPLRLNGMFAFAILDLSAKTMFLARDRFGEKPLYYASQRGLFLFASELQALAQHRSFEAECDPKAIQKLFAYGFIPSPKAFYRHSSKLPAGHHLTLHLDSGRQVLQSYWRFSIEPDDALAEADEPRLVEELSALLSQAVKRRMIADVPLGFFLSGGLDSSGILAAAAKIAPAESLQTFTIGFRERSYDESGHAKTVADAIGSHHRVRILEMEQARKLIPSVLSRLGEPLGDPSILPTHMLSCFARETVTVALTGDGGDELFAGYDPFAALAPAKVYTRLVPQMLHRQIRRLADLMPRSSRNMSLDFKVRRALTGLSYNESMWNPVWMAPLDPGQFKDIFHEPLSAEELYEEAIALWDKTAASDPIDKTLEYFTNLYLKDNILTKADSASMMTSLETRAVFLDNDIVEFCRRLPHKFKIRRGERKYLLRRAVSNWLPKEIVARPKKGFGIPLADWLNHIPASPAASVAGVDRRGVDRYWAEHRSGTRDHRLFLWNWLSLEGSLPRQSEAVALKGAA